MIEKMKFLSITGPKSDFDRVVNIYLNKYDIHLENALSELSAVHDLKPFVEINPYKDLLLKSEDLVKQIKVHKPSKEFSMTPSQASEIINHTLEMLKDLDQQMKDLKEQQSHYTDLVNQIEPFRHFDYDINKILNLKFIKFRFGKISHEFFNKFSRYVYDNLNSLFFECDSDRDYVWGIYFVPAAHSVKIDAIYASLHFERIILSDEYEGTPEQAYRKVLAKRNEISHKLSAVSKNIQDILNQRADELLTAHSTLITYNNNFDLRKLAACTKEGKKQVFYILCGWITQKDADLIIKDTETDPNINIIIEEGQESETTKPPTKLKNKKVFKPFEMFVKMYGLPAYNEIDPTSFVAITYSLIFGIMFGDAGQGLLLALGGALLYKYKKMAIAAIISMAGVFSIVFGFLYGSIFGFEDLIEPIWLSPMHNVMTVLLTSVGFGVALIMIAMILNIINGIKERRISKVLFDTNGVSGLVFYIAAITCVALLMTGRTLPATILLIIFFGIPLLLIFFREPLERFIEKKAHFFPEHKGMFFVESFFELFEVLLSYVTNTISFLRIGAFALSHAAIMGVVMLLAGVETGDPNIIVIILGNLFVAAMEGLIVGIQVLRLEFYEMFSRFYKGTGKEFKPYKNK
ncbi:ATPase [Mobilitalea sibirica]|uniref:ATPase n=1 Tax=Mobilitalea sibirica TaxID=1462919 RepID=A0A8J7HC21_9FIRM|nr:V-type ATPase 116kDa subunit family protein [Mobilitalea sibirica]MBH1942346.1 ATPase [Mobilitalea sibirica]